MINITNPASPWIAGSLATPDAAMDVAVWGHHAYIADRGEGVLVIDLTDPTTPQILNRVYTSDNTDRVTVSDGCVFASRNEAGLAILPAQCETFSGVGSHGVIPVASSVSVSPNPGLGQASIEFRTATAGPVQVSVYDIAGRSIRSLHTGVLAAGEHHLSWGGDDERGRAVAGGVYFIRASTMDRSSVTRFVMLR